MVKVLDCSQEIREFELQSCYHIHFQTNASWERYELLYLPSYGLNSITTVLLQGWLQH